MMWVPSGPSLLSSPHQMKSLFHPRRRRTRTPNVTSFHLRPPPSAPPKSWTNKSRLRLSAALSTASSPLPSKPPNATKNFNGRWGLPSTRYSTFYSRAKRALRLRLESKPRHRLWKKETTPLVPLRPRLSPLLNLCPPRRSPFRRIRFPIPDPIRLFLSRLPSLFLIPNLHPPSRASARFQTPSPLATPSILASRPMPPSERRS
mmetsp:Transcript_28146/g.86024  ORF Transcript_28146/g.86024 Transcript_28146/m.86024 type:complete len:204 (-) Transcript_28146:1577-2188(-)